MQRKGALLWLALVGFDCHLVVCFVGCLSMWLSFFFFFCFFCFSFVVVEIHDTGHTEVSQNPCKALRTCQKSLRAGVSIGPSATVYFLFSRTNQLPPDSQPSQGVRVCMCVCVCVCMCVCGCRKAGCLAGKGFCFCCALAQCFVSVCICDCALCWCWYCCLLACMWVCLALFFFFFALLSFLLLLFEPGWNPANAT